EVGWREEPAGGPEPPHLIWGDLERAQFRPQLHFAPADHIEIDSLGRPSLGINLVEMLREIGRAERREMRIAFAERERAFLAVEEDEIDTERRRRLLRL